MFSNFIMTVLAFSKTIMLILKTLVTRTQMNPYLLMLGMLFYAHADSTHKCDK